jgi:hypothetical protein
MIDKKRDRINKTKGLMFFIIGFMLITGGVSAMVCDGTLLGTFKQNTNINLRQICDTCTYVTLSSLTYPNSTTLTINTNMTKVGVDYNYTFYAGTLGSHYYSVFGNKDGVIATETFCFEVTPSGFIGTLGFYIIILILSLGFIILGYSIEDAWVIVLGGMGLVLVGLFILIYGVDGMKDSAYTYGFGIITIMLGAYFAVRGALEKMDLDL